MPLSLVNHSALALFAQRTRIPTSARSIGFCAIWVCISSSSNFFLGEKYKYRRPRSNRNQQSSTRTSIRLVEIYIQSKHCVDEPKIGVMSVFEFFVGFVIFLLTGNVVYRSRRQLSSWDKIAAFSSNLHS